ncbi:RICIN domain-containing protein [Nonomuraea basaltis]|uniref:RICIN domain-containing protein n=1 Tax=Nonomuraea basaltis TaxID=2495887 RepID=UPI00110C4F14|nr:RICIN domain-containing protein [Nonomuraea basaltis]TMR97865.1 RICIN domain-containing protein [Nonomuraea basaltis]
MSLSRRQLFQATGATTALTVVGQIAGTPPALAALPWARSDIGVSAYEFDLGQVRPTSGRWLDNQNHRWRPHYGSGAAFRIQCANGGRVLGLAGTSQGAQVVLADDNGANNNLWRFL